MRPRLSLCVAVLLVAGCSGSSGNTATPSTSTTAPSIASPTTAAAAPTTVTAAPTTVAPTTTAAPTTTTVDLPKVFQDLMTRHDQAVTDVLADPRVATDSANPKIAALVALFPPNSSFVAGSLKNWTSGGETGRFYKPNKGTTLSTTTVQNVTTSTATEATFTVCSVHSYSVVDSAGNPIEASAGVTGGLVVAVNVEGRWLLRDLTQTPGDQCPKPGAAG
jgi:hypothetical protein